MNINATEKRILSLYYSMKNENRRKLKETFPSRIYIYIKHRFVAVMPAEK
jgi:hypothetical protein